MPTPAAAISRPAMAGPVVKARAWLVAAMVMARGNASRPTSAGRSAARAGFSNAAATATSRIIPYRTGRLAAPARVAKKSPAEQPSGTSCAIIMIRRRSWASASAPPTSVSAGVGRNWTRPINPR